MLAAVIAMARTLARGPARLVLAAAAAAVALLVPGVVGQTLTILAAGLVGAALFRGGVHPLALHLRFPIGRRLAVVSLALFGVLLVGLPVLRAATGAHGVDLFAAFYRAGALVFGGGHVVLPLLDEATVASGWVGQEQFLAGYGAAQAMPGPLFTFSAYLGAIGEPSPNGVAGAGIALVAIFLPSFLLLGGVLPLWSAIRDVPSYRRPSPASARASSGSSPRRCGIPSCGRRSAAPGTRSSSPSCCRAPAGAAGVGCRAHAAAPGGPAF